MKLFLENNSPFMTKKHTKRGDNIILKEGDDAIANTCYNDVCGVVNNCFANIAFSLRFEDDKVVLEMQKYNIHPVLWRA